MCLNIDIHIFMQHIVIEKELKSQIIIMVWKLIHFPEDNEITGAPYNVTGEWLDSIVLQAAQKVKGIEHDYGNPAASLKQAIEIIKEFLPDPIRDAL